MANARRMPSVVVLVIGLGVGFVLGVGSARRGYDSVEHLAKRETERPRSKVANLVKPPAVSVSKSAPKPVYVFEGFHTGRNDSITRQFTTRDDWSFTAECPRGVLDAVFLADSAKRKELGVWMKDVNFRSNAFTGTYPTGGTFVLSIRCEGAWKISVYQHDKSVN